MENKKALKLIDKIVTGIEQNGIDVAVVSEQLKELRPFAVAENIPLLAKVLRRTYEHLETYDGFFIPIPEDEPIELEEEVIVTEKSEFIPSESLAYMISLAKDMTNKINITDLRAYSEALLEYE